MKAVLFNIVFMKVLKKHPPIKTKYLRANHSPFFTKELSKAIMVEIKLRNQYFICKSEEARELVLRFRETFVLPYLQRLNVVITKT